MLVVFFLTPLKNHSYYQKLVFCIKLGNELKINGICTHQEIHLKKHFLKNSWPSLVKTSFPPFIPYPKH